MHAVSQRKMLFSVVRGTNFTMLLSQHLSYTCDHIVEKGSSLHTVKMVSVEHNTISSTKGLEFVVWLHRKHYYSSYEPWRERGFGTKTRDLSVVWHKKAPVPVQLKVTNLFPSSNPLIFSSKVSPINTNIFENKIWRKLRTPPPKIRPNTRYCVECWPGEVGPSPVYLHTKSWRATKKKADARKFLFPARIQPTTSSIQSTKSKTNSVTLRHRRERESWLFGTRFPEVTGTFGKIMQKSTHWWLFKLVDFVWIVCTAFCRLFIHRQLEGRPTSWLSLAKVDLHFGAQHFHLAFFRVNHLCGLNKHVVTN